MKSIAREGVADVASGIMNACHGLWDLQNPGEIWEKQLERWGLWSSSSVSSPTEQAGSGKVQVLPQYG